MVQNALTIYDKIQDANTFLESAGRDIAASKIFGDLTVSQGKIFAWECSVRRTPPLSLAIDYHLMFNRLTMKAEAMLAKFHERGGVSEEVCRSPERVEIKLTSNGVTTAYSLTWEDAQGESFPYETKSPMTEDKVIDAINAWKAGSRGAKQPALKTKYKTPRSRMQMLWARLVSDAVRAKMPEVNSGRYTPEEFDASDDDPQAGGDGQVVDAEYEVKPQTEASSKPANGSGSHAEKTADPLAGAVPAMQGTISDEKGDACLATPDQVTSIRAAMNELGMTNDQRAAALAKRNVKNFMDLSHAQATELLGKLQANIDKKRQTALDAANGRTEEKPLLDTVVTQAVVNRDVSGPATETQVATAKSLLTEMEQTSPGATARFVKAFKESGRDKLADMTGQEIDALIEQLKHKNIEKFFTESLKPKIKPEDGDEAAGAVAKN